MTNEQLAVLAQQGDRRALFDLWEAVKPFCMAAAGHVYRRHDPAKLSGRGVTLEDLQQETYCAFRKALAAFKPERVYKFTTYLSYPLKNAFAQLLGYGNTKRDPLDDCISFDAPAGEDNDAPLSDVIEDPEAAQQITDVEDDCYTAALHTALETAMRETCDPAEQRILKTRFYLNQTRGQCAETLGMTKAGVRQLESRALRNMRKPEARCLLNGFREEYAYSVSTSFSAWSAKGSNPERVTELLERDFHGFK